LTSLKNLAVVVIWKIRQLKVSSILSEIIVFYIQRIPVQF